MEDLKQRKVSWSSEMDSAKQMWSLTIPKLYSVGSFPVILFPKNP